MSIWGKIIGGAAGLAMGGPLGALIGVSVGAAVDASVERAMPSEAATRHITFTIGVIALAAKMAKADGLVTREEVIAFKQVFKVPPSEMRNVGRIFDLARKSTDGYQAYAKQISDLLKGTPRVLEDLLEGLFFIAKADGEVHPKELEFLEVVARIFGFSDHDFECMSARHVGADVDSPYTILGIDPSVDNATLKKHYRKLVIENHPDKLMSEGVPHEFIAVATERIAQINAAYDVIAKQRKI